MYIFVSVKRSIKGKNKQLPGNDIIRNNVPLKVEVGNISLKIWFK